MRLKIYLDKAHRGKTEPELEESELKALVPNYDELVDEDGREDYKARTATLEQTAVDERIILREYETYASIVQQVAARMKRRIDTSDDNAVLAFLHEFAGLSEEDRRKYGVWEDSDERKQPLPVIRKGKGKGR